MGNEAASTRTGKIARLPLAVREEVCRRLRDRQPGRIICAWLNGLDEVKSILHGQFEGVPVDDNNISQWRQGGYQDWLAHQDVLDTTKRRSQWALEMAEAGKNIFGGAAVVAGGQLAELLEDMDIAAQREMLMEKPETFVDLVNALAKLKKGELDNRTLELKQKAHATSERALDLAERKFRERMVAEFMKWYGEKAAGDIMAKKASKEVKMDELQLLFFGPRPNLPPAAGLGLTEGGG